MILKEKCVGAGCKNKLPMREIHFIQYGNFCKKCDAKMNKDIREGRGVRKMMIKQGLINDYII